MTPYPCVMPGCNETVLLYDVFDNTLALCQECLNITSQEERVMLYYNALLGDKFFKELVAASKGETTRYTGSLMLQDFEWSIKQAQQKDEDRRRGNSLGPYQTIDEFLRMLDEH
jgi:hypothetical protein